MSVLMTVHTIQHRTVLRNPPSLSSNHQSDGGDAEARTAKHPTFNDTLCVGINNLAEQFTNLFTAYKHLVVWIR